MADKEDALAISEESKAMLEDHVKKGKARKFILITKGASIKTLIVFKKGPYGPKIMAAKKEGFKGEATCGVVTGKGGQRRVSIAREQRCCQFHEDRRRARCRTLQDCQTP